MSKITDYLGERLDGEVTASPSVREKFSTDKSIFQITPDLVVYPRTINDIKKTARFVWRLAERGQNLPITPRGFGTDTTGGAIGSGVILSFSDHMSRILEFDAKSQMVRVQPGISHSTLQEVMATYGLFFPIKPTDSTATIGGMIAQNASGTKSVKYGPILHAVDCVEVVLANGEVIHTGRLNKRELSRKKGLQTMEGEIYRAIDALIDENSDLIDDFATKDIPNAIGFPIHLVKDDKESFDLTPLMVGSQGTLGIITQAILRLAPLPEDTSLIAIATNPKTDLDALVPQILDLGPSEFKFVDGDTLKFVQKKTANASWKRLFDSLPDKILFIEFDDKNRAKCVKKLKKILTSMDITNVKIAESWEDQEKIRSVYKIVNEIVNFYERGTSALPLMDNVFVDPKRMSEFILRAKEVLDHCHIGGGIWGNLGSGIITVRPLINLENLGQRQAVNRFMSELRGVVIEFDGSIAAETGEGRLHTPFAAEQYAGAMGKIFADIKKIFDPFNILNPGVKLGTTKNDLSEIMRKKM